MKYLILTLLINCHFVTPTECKTMCKPKGVKSHTNWIIGLIINECVCKYTYELEPNNDGYIIETKMKRIKKHD